jgi:hypothetical protein
VLGRAWAEQGCWAEGKEGGLGCLREKELGRGAGVEPAGPKWGLGFLSFFFFYFFSYSSPF